MTLASDALDGKVARIAEGRRCPVCGEFLSRAEQAAGCPRCETPRPCPDHMTWPLDLKRYAMAELLRRRFPPWLSEQEVWERLLKDATTGTLIHPEPGKLVVAHSMADVYAAAQRQAEAWIAAGRPVRGITLHSKAA